MEPQDSKASRLTNMDVIEQSPMDQLPSELLRSIFLLLPDHRNTLISVCRRWRELIIITSQFWTVISISPINPKSRETIPTNEWLPILKSLLERSGSMPLKVIWNFPFNLSSTSERVMKEITPKFQGDLITCLFDYAPFSRWRSLEIRECGRHTPSQKVLNRLLGPFALKELSIKSKWVHLSYLLELLEKSAVVVTHIHSSVLYDRHLEAYPVLLGGVTALSIVEINPRVADLCRNLSTLRIKMLPEEHCVLPQLRSLHVEQNFDLQQFVYVVAPLLKYLRVKYFTEYGRIYLGGSYQLPCLHTLTISRGQLWPLVYFRADALEKLCIDAPLGSLKESTAIINRLLDRSDYRISPFILVLNTPLRLRTMLRLLQRSPRIRNITISINPLVESIAYELFEEIVHSNRQEGDNIRATDTKRSWQLCPDLTTLHLLLDWAQVDTDYWTEKAHGILRGRSGGPMESVICEWSDGNRINVTMSQALGNVRSTTN